MAIPEPRLPCTMGPGRTHTRLRALGALRGVAGRGLVLVALLAHGQTLAHDLLERHELCPEHGELVHADEAHAHGGDRLLGATREAAANSTVQGAPASAEQHDHEHCALAGSRSDLNITAAQACVRPEAPSAPIAVAVADTAQRPRDALYRLAPKQSPPA